MPTLPSGHPPVVPHHHTTIHNTSLASPCADQLPQTSQSNNTETLGTPHPTPHITASPSLYTQSGQGAEPFKEGRTVASLRTNHMSNTEGTKLKARKTAPGHAGSRAMDPARDHSRKRKAENGPVGLAQTAAKQRPAADFFKPNSSVDPKQRSMKEFFVSKKTRAGVTI
eukprot:TRINITY_DN4236_c0_g1_i1.p1 TRINITY_DN4236_c0_g1~~TRINITY_DN4236_c0_g1_i1.p1  ORF type:complete len:191 (-),score=20.28 TRINITY_DN4236_c0_g1_i1:55-561(-)